MKGALLLLLAASTVSTHGSRAKGDEVGVVAEYRPVSGRYVFERGTERIPVQIGTPVQSGDRVSLPAGAIVIVQLGTGRQLTLEQIDTVPPGPLLGGVLRFFRTAQEVFDPQFRQLRLAGARGGERCGAANASTSPLELPILSVGARLVAGTRDLPITWLGGCGPYAVAVLSGSDTIAVRRGIDADRVRLDRLGLPPGLYRIVLSDGAGHRVEGRLEGVAALPALPPDIANDSTVLGVVAQAIWLAELDAGKWRYDAFERLRPLVRAGNPLAGSIADVILWGRPNDRRQR